VLLPNQAATHLESEVMNQIAVVVGTSVLTALVMSAIFLFTQPSPPSAAPVVPESGRVQLLEKKLAAVERRLGAVEANAARSGGAQPAAVPRIRVADLRDDAKAAEEVVLGVLDSGDPLVANKVQDVVRDQLDIAREERFQERVKMRQQRISEQVDKLADDNNLPPATRSSLRKLLVAEHGARMTVMRDARQNMRWEEAREKMQESRKETDSAVGELLVGDALTDYEAWRAQTNRGPGRRGSRGDNGASKRPATQRP
jgi:hypothetical protein